MSVPSCGHVGVPTANEVHAGKGNGKGTICIDCYRERDRERHRRYRKGGTPAKPALKSAGHARGARSRLSDDPEVEAALGVLRDARGRRRGNQGYVYCIWEYKDGGGMEYVKVGFSTNPQARVAELQTGNPRPLKLISMKEGTLDDEAALHAKYIKDNVLQEWFRPSKELLLEFDLDGEGKPFAERKQTTS